MIGIILSFCAGCICGIAAGLIPGFHSNTIAAFIATSSLFGSEALAFMIALAITQNCTECIPAIYLGAPSENTFTNVLPGHRLLLAGHAYEAVCLTLLGGLVAICVCALLTPLFFLYIEQNAQEIMRITPFVLLFACGALILSEKKEKWGIALFVMLACASQGMLFSGHLFALITGYFGIAGTLYSLKEKNVQKPQSTFVHIPLRRITDALVGIAGGTIVCVMPGIGSNVAATILRVFRKHSGSKGYLTLLGSINTTNFFFSLATLLALHKARNGVMLALTDKLVPSGAILLQGTLLMLIAAGIGGMCALIIAKRVSTFISEKRVRVMTIGSLILMLILVFLLDGVLGLITVLFSTAAGLFAITSGVKRSLCMGSLIIPVLGYYIFIFS